MAIIIDNKHQDYHVFIAKALEMFKDYNVKGIAIVALTDSVEALSGYWNMDVGDKVRAETHIRFDAIDGFIQANKERYEEVL